MCTQYIWGWWYCFESRYTHLCTIVDGWYYFEWQYSPVGTEQAKPLSGGETLLFSLLPPPFGAIDPTFVCKTFEIFKNIWEYFRTINPAPRVSSKYLWYVKYSGIFWSHQPYVCHQNFRNIRNIWEYESTPSACVCKTLTVSPPSTGWNLLLE